jgi:succinate-semialdehyde dehydrogenase / glutarate-semialdehyde dehydrogenase
MQPATAPNPIGCLVQQQDEILAQAHRTCRDDRSLQFLAEIEAIVHKAAVIMHSKGDEFAKPIPLEMGKPFRETQREVDFSADILDFYAGQRREASCS